MTKGATAVAERLEGALRAFVDAWAGHDAEVRRRRDRARHPGLVLEQQRALLNEALERRDLLGGQTGPVLQEHPSVVKGVDGGGEAGRALAGVGAVAGSDALDEAALTGGLLSMSSRNSVSSQPALSQS